MRIPEPESRTAGSPAVAVLFTLLSAAAAGAQPPPPPPSSQEQSAGSGLKALSLEQLTRIAVLSTSRQAEVVTQAAAAISVITSDEIRRAGVTTIGDALRLAAGVVVGRDGNTWAISARGFHAGATNKMVVLLDGRSVYSPLFSGVFWDVVDLALVDIDRIEVVRGAGGTLWGANAVNGVINIITKLASETQGLVLEAAGGSHLGMVTMRYGGKVGTERHYRTYLKVRDFQPLPFASGQGADNDLRGVQVGFRVDSGAATRSAWMVRADTYRNQFGLFNSSDGKTSGVGAVARYRRTLASGAQLQLQAYYDTTYRQIPVQYTERRHTADAELQYAFSASRRHHIVTGVGYNVTRDTVTAGTFGFDPPSRTSPLLNLFIQDEISLVPGRLAAIVGTKLEHNDFTGFEYQPTGRLRWTLSPRQNIWGGVSRAVRMPTRIDSDLRFTAGTPIVVVRGNPAFKSETVIASEIGYRLRFIPKMAVGITAFTNSYDNLRSQEPTPPLGLPIVLGNKHQGRVSGFEAGAQLEPLPSWQIRFNYSRLVERFSFEPDSRDTTGGSLEHNDPPHQIRLRSYADLPGKISVDLTARWISALPRPAVPGYAEITLRVARTVAQQFEVELVGDNLLHRRHLELVQVGPAHALPRSVFARLTWRRP